MTSSNKYKILVIEDEANIRSFVETILETNGYQVFTAGSCRQGMLMYSSYCPDLIILDLGLPDGDGMEVIESIREIADTPVIVVSARQDEEEKIRALDAGADDYVTKPFYMGELQARIRAALRKRETYTPDKSSCFEQGDLSVDFEKRQVKVAGEEIHLTPIEYRILTLLIANRGKVLTHNYILKEIWGYAEGVEAGTLRVFVATLRRKIEKNPSQPQHIVTEVGVGSRFR